MLDEQSCLKKFIKEEYRNIQLDNAKNIKAGRALKL